MHPRSVLLAAGRGERLGPLGRKVPKPLLPMLDVPLGAFALNRLLDVRAPVLVNASHLGDLLEPRLSPWSRGRSFEVMSESPEPFGTAGALAALAGRIEEPLLTANADLLTDLDFDALLDRHASGGAPATIAVRGVKRGADLRGEGERAGGFVDRRVHDEPGWRWLGAAVFDPEVIAAIPTRRPLGLGESVLRPLAERGELAIFEHHGYALDVGTPVRFLQGSLDLLCGRVRGPREPPGEIVEVPGGRAYSNGDAEPSDLGAGAIVLEAAVVAPGARVEQAVVWPGEVVPSGTGVRNAIFIDGHSLATDPVPGGSCR